MHEMSYCEGVVEAVERRARGRRVVAVGVRIGAVHRVVDKAFAQSFEIAAAGGAAAEADVHLTVVPAHGHCMDCRADFATPDPTPACPHCGSLEVAVDGGDEVILEWLEFADPALEGGDVAEHVPPHTHAEA